MNIFLLSRLLLEGQVHITYINIYINIPPAPAFGWRTLNTFDNFMERFKKCQKYCFHFIKIYHIGIDKLPMMVESRLGSSSTRFEGAKPMMYTRY